MAAMAAPNASEQQQQLQQGRLRQGLKFIQSRSPTIVKNGVTYAKDVATPVLEWFHLGSTAQRLYSGGDALVDAVDGRLGAAEKKVSSVTTWTKGKVGSVREKVTEVSGQLANHVGAKLRTAGCVDSEPVKEPAVDGGQPLLSAQGSGSGEMQQGTPLSHVSFVQRSKNAAVGALRSGARCVVSVVPEDRVQMARGFVMAHGGDLAVMYTQNMLKFARQRMAIASQANFKDVAKEKVESAAKRTRSAAVALQHSVASAGRRAQAHVTNYAKPVAANTSSAFTMLLKHFEQRGSVLKVPGDMLKLTVQTMGLRPVDTEFGLLVPQVRQVFASLIDVPRLLHGSAEDEHKDEVELDEFDSAAPGAAGVGSRGGFADSDQSPSDAETDSDEDAAY